MLTEFLEQGGADNAVWSTIMPGIRACRFSLHPTEDGSLRELPAVLAPGCYESFFCFRGSLTLEREHCGPITVSPQELFLLSDSRSLSRVRAALPLTGVLVTTSADEARESVTTLCRLLGSPTLRTDRIAQLMEQQGGCALLCSTPWISHVFSALDVLPPEEQGRYCVLKTLDLLYLVCIRSPLLSGSGERVQVDSYLTRTVAEMRSYMETHLDEKLTIDEVSQHFHISPTAFKTNFRRLYGQPVHQWLQAQRLRRATALLRSSPATILQIAQAVGYEGVSQFNVAFKRQYAMTPMQYRKKSNSGEI